MFGPTTAYFPFKLLCVFYIIYVNTKQHRKATGRDEVIQLAVSRTAFNLLDNCFTEAYF